MKRQIQILRDQTEALLDAIPILGVKDHRLIEQCLVGAIDSFEIAAKKLEEIKFTCSCCNRETYQKGQFVLWAKGQQRNACICDDCDDLMTICEIEYVEEMIDKIERTLG